MRLKDLYRVLNGGIRSELKFLKGLKDFRDLKGLFKYRSDIYYSG